MTAITIQTAAASAAAPAPAAAAAPPAAAPAAAAAVAAAAAAVAAAAAAAAAYLHGERSGGQSALQGKGVLGMPSTTEGCAGDAPIENETHITADYNTQYLTRL